MSKKKPEERRTPRLRRRSFGRSLPRPETLIPKELLDDLPSTQLGSLPDFLDNELMLTDFQLGLDDIGLLCNTIQEKVKSIEEINSQVLKFNTQFSSFLQGLQINSQANRFRDVPNRASFFKPAEPEIVEDPIPPPQSPPEEGLDEEDENSVVDQPKIPEIQLSPVTPKVKVFNQTPRLKVPPKTPTKIPTNTLLPTRKPTLIDTPKKVPTSLEPVGINKSVLKRKPGIGINFKSRKPAVKRKCTLPLDAMINMLPLNNRQGAAMSIYVKILEGLDTNKNGITKQKAAQLIDEPSHKAHLYLNNLVQAKVLYKEADKGEAVFLVNPRFLKNQPS